METFRATGGPDRILKKLGGKKKLENVIWTKIVIIQHNDGRQGVSFVVTVDKKTERDLLVEILELSNQEGHEIQLTKIKGTKKFKTRTIKTKEDLPNVLYELTGTLFLNMHKNTSLEKEQERFEKLLQNGGVAIVKDEEVPGKIIKGSKWTFPK